MNMALGVFYHQSKHSWDTIQILVVAELYPLKQSFVSYFIKFLNAPHLLRNMASCD